MKLRRILFVLMAILLVMALFACNTTKVPPTNGGDEKVPTLADLPDYSSEARYYNVQNVTYHNTEQQESLLETRMEERRTRDDLSVPLKIFIECDASEIILAMGRAGLNYEKMNKTVNYLAGQESPIDMQSLVASGVWEDNDDWSFFDDWEYYEELKKVADDSTNNNDSDNAMRQRRKIMRQIFKIGMTGDEFARLVYEELTYAYSITRNKMLLAHNAANGTNYEYDEYVKKELSYDTLVYFKAFDDFSKASKAKTVQLYGYYYNYNKKAYDTTDDATFEKELMYSHKKTFKTSEWFDYLQIQRNNYINSYRYTAEFYKKFYQVHFQFQELIEDYDIIVYEIPSARTDEALKYSREMQRGMEVGFAQQLTLTDHLYIYSKNEKAMTDYNDARSNFEIAKEGTNKPQRDEREYLYNIEQLKMVDYVLTKMNNNQLTPVLRYQILSYSAEMIRNIQSERKTVVLDTVEMNNLQMDLDYQQKYDDLSVKIGRTNAIVAQLDRSYSNAAPESQYTKANGAPWDGIRTEVKAALSHDYSQYSDGTKKKEALDNLIIKKKTVNPDGSDFREGIDNHALAREEYDTSHNISRFLHDHDVVLRYAIGQVEIELSNVPTKASSTTFNLQLQTGDFTCGNDGKNRNMPNGAPPTSHPNPLASVTFSSGMTLTEGLKDVNKVAFLTNNASLVALDNETYTDAITAAKRYYKYTFEGWYIDKELKYKVREDEKIKYDLYLYPGYSVKVQTEPYSSASN